MCRIALLWPELARPIMSCFSEPCCFACVDNEDGVAEMLRTVDHEALHLQSRTRMSLLLNERMQNLFAQLQAASGISALQSC